MMTIQHAADADYNARRRHRSLLQVQAVQSISRGGSHGQRGSNPVQAVQSIENQEPAYVPIYKPYPVPGPPSVIPVPVPSPVDRIVPVPIPVPIPIPIPAPAPISAPSQPPAQVPPVSASLPGPAPNEEKQDRRPPSSLEQTDIRPVTVILFPILNQQPNNPPPRADAGAKHPFNVLG